MTAPLQAFRPYKLAHANAVIVRLCDDVEMRRLHGLALASAAAAVQRHVVRVTPAGESIQLSLLSSTTVVYWQYFRFIQIDGGLFLILNDFHFSCAGSLSDVLCGRAKRKKGK